MQLEHQEHRPDAKGFLRLPAQASKVSLFHRSRCNGFGLECHVLCWDISSLRPAQREAECASRSCDAMHVLRAMSRPLLSVGVVPVVFPTPTGDTTAAGIGRSAGNGRFVLTTTLVPGRLLVLAGMLAILVAAARGHPIAPRWDCLILLPSIDPADILCWSCSA